MILTIVTVVTNGGWRKNKCRKGCETVPGEIRVYTESQINILQSTIKSLTMCLYMVNLNNS